MSVNAINVSDALDKIEELLKDQSNSEAAEHLAKLGQGDLEPQEQVRFSRLYGVTLSRLGNVNDAVMQFRRSRHEAEKLNDKRSVAQADEYLGAAYHQRNRLDEARYHYANALNIWNSLGDKEGQARGHRNMGNLYTDRGEDRAAAAEYDDSSKLYRELNMPDEMAPAILHKATMAYQRHGLTSALDIYRKAIEEEKCRHYLVLNNYGFMLMLNEQIEDGINYPMPKNICARL